jgi:CBS-domain-containing membrane protein
VPPHAPIKEVARVLAETGAAAAPVVSATGVVLGTITALDIVRDQDHGPREGRHTAAEVMRRHPVTIGADTPLDHAAHLLTNRRTTHLVVLDADGTVIGVLDRRALLTPLCRPDDEIETDAVAVIRAQVPPGSGTIRVCVRNGVVHLTGDLAGQTDNTAVRRALQAIAGVIDVHDDVVHPDTATTSRHR